MMEGTGTLESQLEATKVCIIKLSLLLGINENVWICKDPSLSQYFKEDYLKNHFPCTAKVCRGACPEDSVEADRRPRCCHGRETNPR